MSLNPQTTACLRLCAATQGKAGGSHNGDAFAIFRREGARFELLASNVRGESSRFLELGDSEHLLVLVDGLGHGRHASVAAERVLDTIEAALHEGLALSELVEACHSASLDTRGVVLGIAALEKGQLSFAGVGDITAEVGSLTSFGIRDSRSLHSNQGIVGYQLPSRIDTWTTSLGEDDVLLLCTDGLVSSFALSTLDVEALRDTSHCCALILERFATERDDATVLLVRGEPTASFTRAASRPRRAQLLHASTQFLPPRTSWTGDRLRS